MIGGWLLPSDGHRISGDFPVRYVNVGQRVSDGNQKNDGSFFRQCHVRHRFWMGYTWIYQPCKLSKHWDGASDCFANIYAKIPNGLMTISQDGQPKKMSWSWHLWHMWIVDISGLLTIKHMFGCKVQCLINDGWLMITTILWWYNGSRICNGGIMR